MIIDPGDEPANLGLLIKRVASRQARYVNKMEKRSGSLWEGRYKSSPTNASEYLLVCCRYVELNPLPAGMVDNPNEYPWSSCMGKTGIKKQPWLNFDPFYLSLGKNSRERAEKYREWLYPTIPEEEWKLFSGATQRGQLTDDKKFAHEVSVKIGRCLELRGPGRPKNKK